MAIFIISNYSIVDHTTQTHSKLAKIYVAYLSNNDDVEKRVSKWQYTATGY